MNVYGQEFIDLFHPITETIPEDFPRGAEYLKARKRELKKQGYTVRSKWFSSLGSYGLRAIRFKLGEPSEETKEGMKRWTKF